VNRVPTLRSIKPGDEPFLREVYAASRQEELALTGWAETQKEAFLRMQFDAQHHHYQTHYPGADFSIVLEGDQPIGRLYVDRGTKEFRIIDIALLPAWRGQGLGTRLIEDILGEAGKAGKPVRIYVERFNRARSLYQRLGFQAVEEGPVYSFMERLPGSLPYPTAKSLPE
jgi:ribosomal protein S18 acetylase RimI-like enzyme